MKYRWLFSSAILLILFSFICVDLNQNYLMTLEEDGIQGALNLLTAYAGYNFIFSHAGGYVLFLLCLLVIEIPSNHVQLLTRMTRKKYLWNIVKRTFFVSLQFTTLFIGVFTIYVLIFVRRSVLSEINFGLGMVLLYGILILYYFFVSTLFCSVFVISFSKTKSFFSVFAISIGLLCLSRFKKIWTPVMSVDIFDLLINNQLYLSEVIGNMGKIVLAIFAIFCITFIVFKEKDILNEKE